MNENLKQKDFLDDFFETWKVFDESVELFDSNSFLEIKPQLRGKKPRYFIGRSDAMIDMVSREVQKVTHDFKSNRDQYEGVIYMMHKISAHGDIVPLYIGKAEKLGKTENLSENITKGKGKLGRWGHGYAYHIGDLSAVAYAHEETHQTKKYKDWAELLFKSYPVIHPQKLVLKEKVFFWMKAWEKGSVGLWKEFGTTNLTFLEYLLIGVSTSVYPEVLLNREGQNR
jgi:hypothetical protein